MTVLIKLCAQYLFAGAPLIVAAVLRAVPSERRRRLVLTAVVVAVLSVAMVKVAGALYYDPRPFVAHHTVPLLPHQADNGFPSDHTTLTFDCAFLLLPYSAPAAAAAAAIGLAVGSARVMAGIHSPLDIIAGILFAALANLIARMLMRPRSPSPA